MLSPELTVMMSKKHKQSQPSRNLSPGALFHHLCLLNPTGLCTAAIQPLLLSSMLAALTELVHEKVMIQPGARQILNECDYQ